MDADLEEYLRNLCASNMVHDYAIEVLLAMMFRQLDAPLREELLQTLLKTMKQTDHFAGITKGNESRSEFFADVVTRAHGQADSMVRRVRIRMGEGRG